MNSHWSSGSGVLIRLFFSPLALINKSRPPIHNHISSHFPLAQCECCDAQRRYAPVNRINVHCGPAGLASVQMCQRESNASGSLTTKWHRGQADGHSCIACHSLAVLGLTYSTGWGLSTCHGYTLTCNKQPTCPRGHTVRSVAQWVVFSHPRRSSPWLTWVITMLALATHLAGLSCSCFWWWRHPPIWRLTKKMIIN